MDLRKEFVLAARAAGANVSQLCRDFQISRSNGYKWLDRYDREGEGAFEERSRRPLRITSTSGETVLQLIELRRKYPRWGAKKLRVLMLGRSKDAVVPSEKTIARILDRAGEPRVRVTRRTRIRLVVREKEKLAAAAPNDVWTVDFKGWWRTVDGQRFEPLTVRDAFSRSVLCLQMLGSMSAVVVKPVFEKLFELHGLPRIIRVDNGAPFACTSAPAGLSRLSAWWTSLGIRVSFSRPAHPEDNGSHERMHVDVAAELEVDAAASLTLQQQAADRWRREFNEIRPHEALEMKTPASMYRRSLRLYAGIRPGSYSPAHAIRRVNRHGCVRYGGKVIFVSESVAGYDVGIRRRSNGRIAVQFYEIDLGTFNAAVAPRHHRPRLVPLHQVPTPKRTPA